MNTDLSAENKYHRAREERRDFSFVLSQRTLQLNSFFNREKIRGIRVDPCPKLL